MSTYETRNFIEEGIIKVFFVPSKANFSKTHIRKVIDKLQSRGLIYDAKWNIAAGVITLYYNPLVKDSAGIISEIDKLFALGGA